MDNNIRKSPGYQSEWKWGRIGQAPLHDGTHDQTADVIAYRQQAAQRVDAFQTVVDDIKRDLNFEVEILPAQLKEEKSALRKQWDRTTRHPGQADRITDYLRAMIIVPEGEKSIGQLNRAMSALADHPLTRARKDQYFTPEKGTGFRSFKTLMDVDGHLAELVLEHGGQKQPHEISFKLRCFERSLREFEQLAQHRCQSREEIIAGKSLSRIVGKAEAMIETTRTLRTQIHDAAADRHGLNSLLSDEMKASRRPFHITDLAKTFENAGRYGGVLFKGLASTAVLIKKEFPELGLR